ncbi:zinc ABC superfamily ATP binding cassette transporter, ABC protein [gut metagenome]|uniref:Zinc ABC superfamily ATP binding cassette transporter, ABC protein n=1 Tax=gut metagenome TaxID=749906 RepID=J9GX56_9ZZZZ
MNTAPLLQIEDVCLSYGERHVLCHITQTIRRDDFIILTGPNGGGKTTLLRLVAGLMSPTRGQIARCDGVIMGYLPQSRPIDRQFPTTVRDIVLSGVSCRKKWWQRYTAADREQTDETLALFHLEEVATRTISDLSGGQWQRTLLARAFVSRPDLLLLDEPETHLDEASRTELYSLLLRYRSAGAVLVVSHNQQVFPQVPGRKIWHVEDGAVVEREEW